MSCRPIGVSAAGVLGAILLTSGAAYAQDLPETKITVIGAPSMINAYKRVEQPFFQEDLPKASGGKVTVDLKPHDQAGIELREVTRLTSRGVVDVSYNAYNYLAGDDPRLEGIDLPGVGLDVDEYKKAANSYLPVVEKVLKDKHNIQLLNTGSITMQVVFCNGPTSRLSDFKGRKVRVFATSQADYLEALGAVAVNIPFTETMPALQQGTVDCAITSTTNGNTARWWEVVTDLYVLPMGWGANFFGANLDFWQKLDPKVRDFLQQQMAELADRQWEQARSDLQDGINCNSGQGECKDGIVPPKDRLLKVNYPTEEDRKLHAEIMQNTVLKKWAERCGAECAKQWNETIGKVVGMAAPAS